MSDLRAAHYGYAYQDLFTAYFLALGLVKGFDSVTVDRKGFEGDRFDDLTVHYGSSIVKRQIKSTPDSQRTFEQSDLTTENRKLRIDNLVRCLLNDGKSTVEEYRICASMGTPRDFAFVDLLEPSSIDPSFDGYITKLYRLNTDKIWPEGQSALWEPLEKARDINRQDFVDFSKKLVIELECPRASLDLRSPGQLEELLLRLLADGVGIGHYPNHGRNLADAAAILIKRAERARVNHETLAQADVENALQLQRDFGRIAQEFPIDNSILIKRQFLLDAFREKIDSQRVIFTGPPGSGKSWLLTELVDELSHDGHLVAKHYCYLEPGDEQVQRRITSNVLFGNLIYDLIQSCPELRGLHQPLYSAGPRELEMMLNNAITHGFADKVILVVDGVDHISRVFGEVKDLTAGEIDIVEELVTLNLPRGVYLVIGSQPGAHLTPLYANAETLTMPEWGYDEVVELAYNFGIMAALDNLGFKKSTEELFTKLYNRSEGNPLYATFLCKQILSSLLQDQTFDSEEFLQQVPQLEGSISHYYDWLLRTVEGENSTGIVAELLGLVDFGLSETELREIRLDLAHRLSQALIYLGPVLNQSAAQGGFRIYHESFRRFITERIRNQGGSIAAIIEPVIIWLKSKGIFADARAHRFLIPCLRRAGKNQEALQTVNMDFVSRSVQAGFSRPAIEENLKLATYIAAEVLDWAALARLAELNSSCWTCFEQKLLDLDLYGRTFAALFGAKMLSERLVFDGKPTFPEWVGLLFCSLCDDAGQVAPWEEYLDVDGRSSIDEIRESVREDWIKFADAEFHGSLRVEGIESVYPSVNTWLSSVDNLPGEYLNLILKRLRQFGGSSILLRLLEEAKLSSAIAGKVKAELARALFADGEVVRAKEILKEILYGTDSPELILECLTLGADPNKVTKHYPHPSGIDIGLDKGKVLADVGVMKLWVESIRIAAEISPADSWVSFSKHQRNRLV